jgi:S-ribosylhomocysteine lyase LuxS involved in autoinducer biosynthesis
MAQSQKGRPATKPVGLKAGFYIAIGTKGSSSTIKIRRDSMAEIDMATKQYEKSKTVTYLGQVVAGKWVDGKNKGKKAI